MRASSRSDFSSLSSWKKASWPLARTASNTSSRSSLARRSRLRPPTGAPFSRLRRRSRSGGVTLSLGSYSTAIFSFPGTSPLLELAALQVVHRQRGGEHRRLDQLLRLASGGDLQGQLARHPVDVLELAQRGPARVLAPPVGAWREPHGERLREILVGVFLRVPPRDVADEAPRERDRRVCVHVRAVEGPEQLDPFRRVVTSVRVVECVARFVAQVHEDLALILQVVERALERLQVGIGEIEGNADDRLPVGASPLVGEVAGRTESLEASRLQLAVELLHVL